MKKNVTAGVMLATFGMCVLLAVAAAAGSGANAQNMNSNANSNMNHGSMKMKMTADQKFAMEAAMGGMMEVEMGRLAAQKGASEEVLQFGKKRVDSHSKA